MATRRKKTDAEVEAGVARRHAELARNRDEERLRFPLAWISSLVGELKSRQSELDGIPENREYTAFELDDMDDLRHACIGVKFAIEAIFDQVSGKGPNAGGRDAD